MKPLALFLLPLLVACSPGAGYVRADRETYNAIAPAFAAYVDADPALDSEQKKRRHETLHSWDARLTQAEKGGDDGE